jgi:hypothetical protein
MHACSAARVQVPQAAEGDVMCCDWSAAEHYVATGADGGVTHVYDVRKFASAAGGSAVALVHEFTQFVKPPQAVLSVAWSPRKPVRSNACSAPMHDTLHCIQRSNA